MVTNKNLSIFCLLRLDEIWRSSDRTELIWIKTNTKKKVDKVLQGEIFILIGFNVKAFTQVNPQQMWMNSNTFPSSSCVNCAFRINFNLDGVHKR